MCIQRSDGGNETNAVPNFNLWSHEVGISLSIKTLKPEDEGAANTFFKIPGTGTSSNSGKLA